MASIDGKTATEQQAETTVAATQGNETATEKKLVVLYVQRGTNAHGFEEAFVGLTSEAAVGAKFAADLVNLVGGDAEMLSEVDHVDVKADFSFAHVSPAFAEKLLAVENKTKLEQGFVNNNGKVAPVRPKTEPASKPATEEKPMTAKMIDGAKGAEKLQNARATAPDKPAETAVEIGGKKQARPQQNARQGRPIAKTVESGETKQAIDFEHLTVIEKIKCVVALCGIGAALVWLKESLERTAQGTSEWAAANKLLLTWGKALGIEPQLITVAEDGTVRFELLTQGIDRFFRAIVASNQPRRVEQLIADAKACNRLRPDQIAAFSEMVRKEIARIDEEEKAEAREAQAQAEAETKAALEAKARAEAQAKAEAAKAQAELEELRKQLAEAKAAQAKATLEAEAAKAEVTQAQALLESATAPAPEPTAEQVSETAAAEIAPADTAQ